MDRSNKDIVSELLNAVTNGDADGLLKNLADDLTWTFFGSHRFGGTLRGKDELMQGLFAVVGEVLKDRQAFSSMQKIAGRARSFTLSIDVTRVTSGQPAMVAQYWR